MADVHVSGHPQYSPPSSYDDGTVRQYSAHRPRSATSTMWPTGAVCPPHGVPAYPAGTSTGVASSYASSSASTPMPMGNAGATQYPYSDYDASGLSHTSPMMSTASNTSQMGYQQTRPQSSMAGHASQAVPAYRVRGADDEIQQLRNKIRELELINEHARMRIRTLEAELANPTHSAAYEAPQSSTGYTPNFNTPAISSAMAASWKARTEARTRLLCSLNRAGNALCAWHDSRRERRAYPPRMAPPGHLNCGCTFEEALFEESLARHGVGSYHPGESVRMDPALRNPLLKVLQRRYGYKDGDFERDPTTGGWVDGEGHAAWEAKAAAGGSSHRRQRTDDRR